MTAVGSWLYTQAVARNAVTASGQRFWDWFCAVLVFLLVQVSAVRLLMTAWVPDLFYAETLGALGVMLGLALGFSKFGQHATWLLGAGYTLAVVPWHLSTAIPVAGDLLEGIASLTARLWFSLQNFGARRPVEDALFFAALMAILYWLLGLSAGYQLTRNTRPLAVILPTAVATLVIQSYDNYVPIRGLALALVLFLAIVLLGRVQFAQRQVEWKERRVFLTSEAPVDIQNHLVTIAAAVIVLAWIVPASLSEIESAARTWNRLTYPLRERLSNAVSALESPYGSGRAGDFYTDKAVMGRSAILGDEPVFTVRVTGTRIEAPPRYYWRGWVYDTYTAGEWRNTNASSVAFDPEADELDAPLYEHRVQIGATMSLRATRQKLLYTAGDTIWVNRPGHVRVTAAPNQRQDLAAWSAEPALAAGDRYQSRAWLANPTVEQLAAAGGHYPEWISERYLQIPEDLRRQLKVLAEQITVGSTTPYDQASAVTAYLRREIAYSTSVPAAPNGVDPVAYVLFRSQRGFCTYYASAEVMLLRSLGIPARLAVGFAQGEFAGGTYTVLREDAHAWPEVYFPGLGWVEFEPTVNQLALARPRDSQLAAGRGENGGAPVAPPPLADSGIGVERAEDTFLGAGPAPLAFLASPPGRALLAGILLVSLALLLYGNARYRYLDRVPAYLSRAYERGEGSVPAWLQRWAVWVTLSAIERSFHAVNVGLRWLGRPAPLHATPQQRADALRQILSSAESEIERVLLEHHNALYARRHANAAAARRAGMRILGKAILQRVRELGAQWASRYNRW